MPVIFETRRLVGYRRCVSIPVSTLEQIRARLNGHHDLFERTIAGPFADPVDRALHLPGASLDR